MPIQNEVDIQPLDFFKTYHHYLPRVGNGNTIEFYKVTENSVLGEKNQYGIREPKRREKAPYSEEKSLILVPGISFNKNGYRIGFGKGYYDRFLAKNKMELKIGLAYSWQVVDFLFQEECDEKLDYIITEYEIIKTAR